MLRRPTFVRPRAETLTYPRQVSARPGLVPLIRRLVISSIRSGPRPFLTGIIVITITIFAIVVGVGVVVVEVVVVVVRTPSYVSQSYARVTVAVGAVAVVVPSVPPPRRPPRRLVRTAAAPAAAVPVPAQGPSVVTIILPTIHANLAFSTYPPTLGPLDLFALALLAFNRQATIINLLIVIVGSIVIMKPETLRLSCVGVVVAVVVVVASWSWSRS